MTTIIVIGGGAAGFFGAITCATAYPDAKVVILEKTRQLLSKVRISGGGRCNVTHSCFESHLLIQNYPRGNKELRSAFTRFQPTDTIQWFESHGVKLKTEQDGRMFPTTDNSETIINCLLEEAERLEIEIRTECSVIDCQRIDNKYQLTLQNSSTVSCDKLLVATGSAPKVADWLRNLGHTMVPPVPSLFTFNVPDSPLLGLAGIAVPKARVSLKELSLEQEGPLLITHWGFSGPAVLKLSAWGARALHDCQYKTLLQINWMPDLTLEEIQQQIGEYRGSHPTRYICGDSPVNIPKNLWKAFVEIVGVDKEQRWTTLTKVQSNKIVDLLRQSTFKINGKTTYKEEFVTCGGVKLSEVDFKTMESKITPGLFFAGEVLNIDGVTGGFNFQNAWTTGWIAGHSIGTNLVEIFNHVRYT